MENKEKMPEWDLSEYYNGVDDPKIGEDLNAYADKAAAFEIGRASCRERVFRAV